MWTFAHNFHGDTGLLQLLRVALLFSRLTFKNNAITRLNVSASNRIRATTAFDPSSMCVYLISKSYIRHFQLSIIPCPIRLPHRKSWRILSINHDKNDSLRDPNESEKTACRARFLGELKVNKHLAAAIGNHIDGFQHFDAYQLTVHVKAH